MRSQGLPSSFLPAHLGINYDLPLPLVVLRDGFIPAGTSQRSPRRSRRSARHCSARHFVDPHSSCSRCEVERLSPSVSISIHLALSLDLLRTVSLPHKRVTCHKRFTAITC